MEDGTDRLQRHPEFGRLLEGIAAVVKDFAEEQISHIGELVKIGLALTAEHDLDRLLEMVVTEARRFTNADGGTLYVTEEDGKSLRFAIVQNESLGTYMGGGAGEITWPPVPLVLADGRENHRNVSAHCALIGRPVSIADVYEAEGFDFSGTRDFDSRTGYRSRSMLLVPMKDHEGEVIGVLQLLNDRDRDNGEVIAFPDHEVDFVNSLASQAATAINNARLIRSLEALLNAFVKSIADAIDEKSPYTAGHIVRVAELTERIIEGINGDGSGRFAGVRFSEDEKKEIRMAAWMHDEGKITTPEHIVDKSTKLETIMDRIELVRLRIEILKRDARIRALEGAAGQGGDAAAESGKYDEWFDFLNAVNVGGEFLAEDKIARIRELAAATFEAGGESRPLLAEEEVANLVIRKGTLTEAERQVINNHVVVSAKMLESLPFPRKLRKVPLIAAQHHEKLDGSGYPRGLKAEEIALPSRILAVADVFEALSASDRPYKPGKRLSEVMKILGFMVKDRHLDEDVCDFIVESGIVGEYARKYLSPRQLDGFEWKGRSWQVTGGASVPAGG